MIVREFENGTKKVFFYKKGLVLMKNICRWYNETSGMKRAYDKGLLDEKWIKNYCLNSGNDCIRKKRFEEEGYISPDYILPDGTVDKKLKEIINSKDFF